MWPEVELVKKENRHEIILFGSSVSDRIKDDGIDPHIFELTGLNYLNIHETCLSNIPDEIANLENLQTLVLHSNKICEISEKLAALQKLKVLDLSRNELKTIPEALTKLPQLVTVNLSFNQLNSVPDFIQTTKLSTLNLSNNRLTVFPGICNNSLVNLSELQLSNNALEEIPSTISLLTALKNFDVSHNKIKSIPAELVECGKLKEINFKDNPISDHRLLKLINQCRTKQILDYLKQQSGKGKKNKSTTQDNESKNETVEKDYTHLINVQHFKDDGLKIVVEDDVKSVRPHIIGCMIFNLEFTKPLLKKFIQIQSRLHDTICDKRNAATIATHDAKKLAPGDLKYTALPPNLLQIQPLNHSAVVTGAELFTKLQDEAEALRKLKKRNVYSGVHKYLYLLSSSTKYPCLFDSAGKVISLPPITNSEVSKISEETTSMFIEVTSSSGIDVARKVMDIILKEVVLLFGKDITVQQIKSIDVDGNLKYVYPSRTDLNFDDGIIKTVRE